VKPEITVEEWREAMQTSECNDPGLTMRELAELLGLSPATTHKRVTHGVASGSIRAGCSKRTDPLSGRTRRVPVYDIIKQKGKAK